jgi:NAD+ kinase
MKVRRACVYVDSFNNPGEDLLRTVVSSAAAYGIELGATPCCAGVLPQLCASEGDCDAAIVLGGDGTILRGLDEFTGRGIPVAGINTGHLGYLASAELADLDEAMRKLSLGQFTVETLPALKAEFPCGKTVYAVNDICLNRALTVGMLHLELGTGSEVIARVAGDGIVISTALGSTAYALSAGGPVLDPDLPAILVVPLCAHQLSLRPIVFSASACLRITVTQARGDAPLVVADGRPAAELRQGESLTITSGLGGFSIIRFSQGGFYARLGRKLGWSTRGRDAD